MDTACLEYCLIEEERLKFERDGFFVVEDALPPEMVEELNALVDRVYDHCVAEEGLASGTRMNLLDFVGKDKRFLELIDWPRTFPKVWDILGWNIQLYHSHLIVTPPQSEPAKKRLGWHQDSGRLNIELESEPKPRVSLKVGFFLTDTTEPDRGNFSVVPGSHLQSKLESPEGSDPEGAMSVLVSPGTAVFFDRRLWHAAGHNHSTITRKVLFYGYSYRWLRPRDDMTVEHMMNLCSPIRRQLLGASVTGGMGYTSPREEDVPLRTWLKKHVGEEAVAP